MLWITWIKMTNVEDKIAAFRFFLDHLLLSVSRGLFHDQILEKSQVFQELSGLIQTKGGRGGPVLSSLFSKPQSGFESLQPRWQSCFFWTLLPPTAPTKWRTEVKGHQLDSPPLTLPSVGCEENRSLARSDWSRSRTQEGGSEKGRGGWRARMQRNGRSEGRGGGREQGGRGERAGRERDGGGGRRSEGSREEGGREGGLRQLLLRREETVRWDMRGKKWRAERKGNSRRGRVEVKKDNKDESYETVN